MNAQPIFVTNLNRAIAPDEDAILYGAGANAIRLLLYLKHHHPGVRVVCVADADKAKQGGTLLGVPVVAPESLAEHDSRTCVLITPERGCLAISEALAKLGFRNLFFFNAENAGIANWGADQTERLLANAADMEQMRRENTDRIAAARSYLGDEKSRNIFDAKLQSIFGGRHTALEALREGDQYFPKDIVSLSANEVFVDCGALDGGTMLDFRRRANTYDHIFAFEPEPWHYELTKAIVAFEKIERCDVYNLAVADVESELRFSSTKDLISSRISEKGEITVRATTLDGLLLGNPHRPSFIKMDIEGAEPGALEGARNIIARDHPKLAICVYHAYSHLFEIPCFIKENFPDYAVYLRQHSSFFETVCYAV